MGNSSSSSSGSRKKGLSPRGGALIPSSPSSASSPSTASPSPKATSSSSSSSKGQGKGKDMHQQKQQQQKKSYFQKPPLPPTTTNASTSTSTTTAPKSNNPGLQLPPPLMTPAITISVHPSPTALHLQTYPGASPSPSPTMFSSTRAAMSPPGSPRSMVSRGSTVTSLAGEERGSSFFWSLQEQYYQKKMTRRQSQLESAGKLGRPCCFTLQSITLMPAMSSTATTSIPADAQVHAEITLVTDKGQQQQQQQLLDPQQTLLPLFPPIRTPPRPALQAGQVNSKGQHDIVIIPSATAASILQVTVFLNDKPVGSVRYPLSNIKATLRPTELRLCPPPPPGTPSSRTPSPSPLHRRLLSPLSWKSEGGGEAPPPTSISSTNTYTHTSKGTGFGARMRPSPKARDTSTPTPRHLHTHTQTVAVTATAIPEAGPLHSSTSHTHTTTTEQEKEKENEEVAAATGAPSTPAVAAIEGAAAGAGAEEQLPTLHTVWGELKFYDNRSSSVGWVDLVQAEGAGRAVSGQEQRRLLVVTPHILAFLDAPKCFFSCHSALAAPHTSPTITNTTTTTIYDMTHVHHVEPGGGLTTPLTPAFEKTEGTAHTHTHTHTQPRGFVTVTLSCGEKGRRDVVFALDTEEEARRWIQLLKRSSYDATFGKES